MSENKNESAQTETKRPRKTRAASKFMVLQQCEIPMMGTSIAVQPAPGAMIEVSESETSPMLRIAGNATSLKAARKFVATQKPGRYLNVCVREIVDVRQETISSVVKVKP